MKRTGFHLLGSALLGLLFFEGVFAQATAQISGTVRDQTGAVLPGVEIMATQSETGISRSTISNETGSYVLPNLPVGPYRMEVSLPGFHTFVQTGIVLQVNGSPVINPVLEVGQVSEQVEVQANASLVETRNSSVGQVIENQRILELPLNGRQVTDLITLAGAAVQSRTARVTNGSDSVAISVAGGLGFSVEYLDKSARPLAQYFNPAAFAQPALGNLGNLGRGSLRGPANWSFEMALSRAFRVTERQRMEVRAEAYNVTNSFRPLLSTTGASLNGLSLATNTFGQIRSAQDPRIMQFALKYIF